MATLLQIANPLFEEWFIDDEFVNEDLKVTEESKAFIHDLIEKKKCYS